MNLRAVTGLGLALGLAGCIAPPDGPKSPSEGAAALQVGRALRPPRSGVQVGSLYYVREPPAAGNATPADLEDLCVFRLDAPGTGALEQKTLPDIDLLGQLEARGALDGLETRAVQLGLTGGLARHYSYRLTNVRDLSMSLVDANRLFESQAFRDRCSGWRENIRNEGWAAYQVLSVVSGDLVFGRKEAAGADASLAAQVAAFEPAVRATLGSSFVTTQQGQGLVIAFRPLPRR